MFDLLDSLDTQQRGVALHDGQRLRVLAGAGTGKTTALTGRAAYLVTARNITPDRILLLTFTRRAARQMVSRTETLIGRVQKDQAHSGARARIVGGTFHSVAHGALRRYAAPLGLAEGFGVIDPSDAADLIDVIRNSFLQDKALQRRLPRKSTLLDIYCRAVDTATTVSEVVVKVAPWATKHAPAISDICREYVRKKRELGVLDFDDLLLYWREALSHPVVGRQIASDYDHVLVDEYQDVNTLQVDVLKLLTSQGQCLTVVGDDAQAIYSFRASSPDHILNFNSDFPDASTLALTTNYRSTQPILDVANALGSEAEVGFSTKLTVSPSNCAPATKPRLVRCADEDGQSDSVCERVLELREQGIALREQAVLVRAAHHSDRLEIELTRRGIPFVKYGGLKYLEAAHVKDLLAAFRLADNPRDELSWFRIFQLLSGVGPAKARTAISRLEIASDGSLPPLEPSDLPARWAQATKDFGPAARSSADVLLAAILPQAGERLVTHAERLRLAVAPLIESNYQDAAARLTDLEALVQASTSAARLSEVAAEHALEPPSGTSDMAGPPVIDEDYMVISTVHSAKGLEWDAVHVIHAADGNFPSDMALSDAAGLEEERRLFYVALTRARRSLDVYVPLRFHVNRHARDDRNVWAQPSRFLTGAVAPLVDEVTHMRPDDFGVAVIKPIDTAITVDAQLNGLWQ